jgi:cobalamin synthase
MDYGSLIEHALITLLVVVFHILLLWMGGSSSSQNPQLINAERRLWRKFVGLLFVVLVNFANATLVLPRGSERAAALIAILLLALIYLDWRHGTRTLKGHEGDSDG